MDDLPDDLEIALIIASDDYSLAEVLAAALPDASLSHSDNFIGGTEIAAFFLLTKDALKNILAFITANRAQVKSAKIRIGRNQISLDGYSVDDAQKLLESQGFQKAVDAVRN